MAPARRLLLLILVLSLSAPALSSIRCPLQKALEQLDALHGSLFPETDWNYIPLKNLRPAHLWSLLGNPDVVIVYRNQNSSPNTRPITVRGKVTSYPKLNGFNRNVEITLRNGDTHAFDLDSVEILRLKTSKLKIDGTEPKDSPGEIFSEMSSEEFPLLFHFPRSEEWDTIKGMTHILHQDQDGRVKLFSGEFVRCTASHPHQDKKGQWFNGGSIVLKVSDNNEIHLEQRNVIGIRGKLKNIVFSIQ
jgi:hypothetical protein